MRALLRYACFTTQRDQSLPGLVLAPAVLFAAPMFFVALYNAWHGLPVYPVVLDRRLGPAGTAALLLEVVSLVATLVAGMAAFRVFRAEVASRGVGAFYLALPPRIVSAAATLYGTAAGTAAYLTAALLIVFITASAPPHDAGRHLLVAVVGAAFGSALGALAVAVSAEYTMLVPVYVGTLLVSTTLDESAGWTPVGATVAVTAVLVTITPYFWGRRCAA